MRGDSHRLLRCRTSIRLILKRSAERLRRRRSLCRRDDSMRLFNCGGDLEIFDLELKLFDPPERCPNIFRAKYTRTSRDMRPAPTVVDVSANWARMLP
jgi:hypothetical protein